jgi:hypothetical protein
MSAELESGNGHVPMTLSDLIAPEAVIPALKAKSKKLVLEDLAMRGAKLEKLPPCSSGSAWAPRALAGGLPSPIAVSPVCRG